MDARPIGVFDSGLGGLTVVKEIIKLLPFENIIYLGDTARVPYGSRSKEVIIDFSLQDANFLVKKNVKCIVIACNTSSSVASDILKRRFKIPVFESISGASKKAAKVSKNLKVGVIGTWATISKHAYRKRILKANSKIKVYEKACPLFVSFIEEGEIRGKLLAELTKKYLKEIRKNRIDTLVLGCTHYPIIAREIGKALGSKTKLVNSGKEEAISLYNFLQKNKMLNQRNTLGDKKYYVTDLNDRFIKVAEMFLGEKLRGKIKKIIIDR